jgi:hypothetical protein
MTWNGLQGFQTPIANDSFIVDGVGALGTAHTERGLTYYEVALCGHMCVAFLCPLITVSYFWQGTSIFACRKSTVHF